MLEIRVGGIYDAETCYHGESQKTGTAYTRIIMCEKPKSGKKSVFKFNQTLWVDGAPPIKKGDRFEITSINRWSVGSHKTNEGEWARSESLNVSIRVIPQDDVISEGTDIFADEPDDGDLPW